MRKAAPQAALRDAVQKVPKYERFFCALFYRKNALQRPYIVVYYSMPTQDIVLAREEDLYG